MDVRELMEALGGEILANKARVVVDGNIVDIGYFDGPDLVFTDAGRELAAAQSNAPAAKTPPKTAEVKVESEAFALEAASE